VFSELLVVDPGGAGDFTKLSDAVSAASEGDTLLLRPGNYPGMVLDGKRLVVIADRDGFITIGGIEIRNLVQGQYVVVSGGITVNGSTVLGLPNALVVDNCQGVVRLESCAFNADQDRPAARIQGSQGVDFFQCIFQPGTPLGPEGTAGIEAIDSTLSLHDSQAFAGSGGAGAGIAAQGSTLFLAGSILVGLGSASALSLSNGFAELIDVELFGGVDLGPGGSLSTTPIVAREIEAPTAVTALTSFEVRVRGVYRDVVFLAFGTAPGWSPLSSIPALYGLLLLRWPPVFVLPAGTIGLSDELALLLNAPALPAGLEVSNLFLQALAFDGLGAHFTGLRTLPVFQPGILP
jgi:hypothetical protein